MIIRGGGVSGSVRSRRAGGARLRHVDAGSANPLAIETDLTSDFADLFSINVDGFEGDNSERLTGFCLGGHGGTVGAAKSSKGLPALVVHALMVPQSMRHHLVAYVHGDQSAT